MSPGIGLMNRRLETKESAISLATSGITKKFNVQANEIQSLETKYDDDSGDWYVASVSYTHLTLPTSDLV